MAMPFFVCGIFVQEFSPVEILPNTIFAHEFPSTNFRPMEFSSNNFSLIGIFAFSQELLSKKNLHPRIIV